MLKRRIVNVLPHDGGEVDPEHVEAVELHCRGQESMDEAQKKLQKCQRPASIFPYVGTPERRN